MVGVTGSKLPSTTRRVLESAVVQFLEENRDLLPMYYLSV